MCESRPFRWCSAALAAAFSFAASASPPLFIDLGPETVPYDLAVEHDSGVVRVVTHKFVQGPDLGLLWSIANDGTVSSQEIQLSQTPGYEFTYLSGAGISENALQFVGISVAGGLACPTSPSVVIAEEGTLWDTSAPEAPTELGFIYVHDGCGYSVATAISNNGVVAGGNADVGQAYQWSAGKGWIPLLDPLGAPLALGWTTDISADGRTIVGTVLMPPAYVAQHAVRWDDGVCTVLKAQVPEVSFGIAMGISPSGQHIVGLHNASAAIWTDGELVEIPALPETGSAWATSVTDDAYVGGLAYGSPDVHGFVWHPSWTGPKTLAQFYGEIAGGAAPLPLQVVRAVAARNGDLHFLVHSLIPDEQGTEHDHAIYIRLPSPEIKILGDFNGDEHVDGSDLAILLGAWGTSNPLADLDDNGIVDGVDLSMVLGAWTG